LKELYVYIYLKNDGWIPCGIVSHESMGRNSSSAFRYGKEYLKRLDSICIDPYQLKLIDVSQYTHEGFSIFNGLRDAGPDAWGRYLFDKKFPGTVKDELIYLAGTNPDRVGALAFGPDPFGGPKIWTPDKWKNYKMRYIDLSMNAQGIEDVLAGIESEAYKQLIDNASGSGGARPKANVIWNGSLHLAKFSTSKDTFNIPAAEYATMNLAKKCGLNVPIIQLSRALNRDVYLIERFDRDQKGNPIHFVSALTMTNIADNQYDAFEYRALVDAVVKYSSAFKDDLLELYKRMVFNIMVNNNDDHLRNFGFLYDQDNKWRLSPLYDVVPALNSTGSYSLSLGIGSYGKEASLKNALSAARFFRLTENNAKELIDEMQEVVISTWQNEFRTTGAKEETIKLFENSFVLKNGY